MLRRFGLLAAAFGLSLATTAPANPENPILNPIPRGPFHIGLQPLASGLAAPNLLVSPLDDTNRQFVVDQVGKVHLIKNALLQPEPVLDLSSRLVTLRPNYDERGLLGLAFDPGFADPTSPGYRRLFTYTSEPLAGPADFTVPLSPDKVMDHQSVVASWTMDPLNPDRIDPASRREILRIDQPQRNHNGGMLAFGHDSQLYIALGDGGGANDAGVGNDNTGHNPVTGNGQDTSTVLGKMLRIDVNGSNSANGKYGIPSDNPFVNGGGVGEIYAHGFRNPFRFSFDRLTGDLLVGDVGQNKIEEVNLVQAGKNYGWRYKEGTYRFNMDGTLSEDLSGLPDGLVDPILQYDHDEGIAILGGFVYRGAAIPELQGKYVFGDYARDGSLPSGRLFYADLATGDIREFILGTDDHPLGLYLKGLGEDQFGELYVLGSPIDRGPAGSSGVVYKITAIPEPSALGLAGIAALLLARRRRAWQISLCLLPVAFSVLMTSPASAAVITLSALKDNTLFENASGSLSNGKGEYLYVGRTDNDDLRRGLIAFNIASKLPAGARIEGATLRLNLSKSGPSGPNTINLHRALKNWGEGTSNSTANGGGRGAPATTNDATWQHALYNTVLWDKPGGDFSPTISASQTVNALKSYDFSGPQMVADIQSWLNSPATNFGWFLIGDEVTSGSAHRFDTRENRTAGRSPTLTITYSVPEPASASLLLLAFLGLRRTRR